MVTAPPLVARPIWRWLALVAVVSIAAQLAWMDPTVGSYDEGLILYGADRVSRGDVPLRDFWSIYMPGSFYADAAVFALFGESAFSGRCLDILVKTAIVGLSLVLLIRFGRVAIALMGATLVLAVLIYLKNYGTPIFPATCASLAVLLATDSAFRKRSAISAAVAGAAVGVAMIFRHDIGVYMLVACAVYALFPALFARRAAHGELKTLAPAFAAGLALTAGPALLFLIAAVPTSILYRDLVMVPLHIYPAMRALPFPPLGEALANMRRTRSLAELGPLSVYLPVVVIVGSLIVEAIRSKRRRETSFGQATVPLFRFMLLAAALLFAKGWVRVSPVHMGASMIVSALLVGAGAQRTTAVAWRRALLGLLLVSGAALVTKAVISAAARRESTGQSTLAALFTDRWGSHAGELCRRTDLPRLRCMRVDPDRTAVATYLVGHGAAGQRVYFGVGRHDRIFVSDDTLAFVSQAVAPTRWHDLHPGIQTTAPVQGQMIAELSAAPVQYVVINQEWDGMDEPNASSVATGVHLLDDYLRSHFHAVFHSGTFTIMAPTTPGLPP